MKQSYTSELRAITLQSIFCTNSSSYRLGSNGLPPENINLNMCKYLLNSFLRIIFLLEITRRTESCAPGGGIKRSISFTVSMKHTCLLLLYWWFSFVILWVHKNFIQEFVRLTHNEVRTKIIYVLKLAWMQSNTKIFAKQKYRTLRFIRIRTLVLKRYMQKFI